jgi:hypothetical protein
MARREQTTRCPLCGAAAYPWVVHLSGRPIDRCEDCGAGVERGAPIDLAAELAAITVAAEGGDRLVAPNRASWQAGVGGEGWAALGEWNGGLLLTPRAVELLLERNGLAAQRPACPPWGRGQRWMWQTILNGITLHPNFAGEVLAGRLRPAGARSRFAFFADAVASVLATPLVLIVTVPVEAVAALFGRGGLMTARLEPS